MATSRWAAIQGIHAHLRTVTDLDDIVSHAAAGALAELPGRPGLWPGLLLVLAGLLVVCASRRRVARAAPPGGRRA